MIFSHGFIYLFTFIFICMLFFLLLFFHIFASVALNRQNKSYLFSSRPHFFHGFLFVYSISVEFVLFFPVAIFHLFFHLKGILKSIIVINQIIIPCTTGNIFSLVINGYVCLSFLDAWVRACDNVAKIHTRDSFIISELLNYL